MPAEKFPTNRLNFVMVVPPDTASPNVMSVWFSGPSSEVMFSVLSLSEVIVKLGHEASEGEQEFWVERVT